MATMNPLERKARSSFIKGLVIAGLIGIIGIGVSVIQIMKLKGEEKARLDAQKTIYVLNENVVSGQMITSDMLTPKKIDGNVIPSNAIKTGDINSFVYTDNNGNEIFSSINEQGQVVFYVTIKDENFVINTRENGTQYIFRNGQEEDIQLNSDTGAVMMAKVGLTKNTIITSEMVVRSDELTDNTTRKQEYNMISLPVDIETDEIIDIRLRMPNGTDYIVVSKKRISILEDQGGMQSLNTFSLNLSEGEILMLSNAIVEAYQILGSRLYVTRYVEPGMQSKAVTTYVPNEDVQRQIQSDPNIVVVAKNELLSRIEAQRDLNRNNINNMLGMQEQDERNDAVQEGTGTEISTQQEERQKYLDSLSE